MDTTVHIIYFHTIYLSIYLFILQCSYILDVHLYFRFSLLSSNINVERETLLRAFITKRLEQVQQLDGNGIILSIPAGEVYDQNAMVYFYFMPEEYESCKENAVYEK